MFCALCVEHSDGTSTIHTCTEGQVVKVKTGLKAGTPTNDNVLGHG